MPVPVVQVRIPFDRKLWRSPAVQKVAGNAARMIRDLWLARSPHLSADYVAGLQKQGSIVIKPGVIIVKNLSEHAAVYETGAKAFNWGLAMLNKGGGKVKRSKDGSKYRIIRIEPKGRGAFRKPSVGTQVIAAFRATVPRGRTTYAAYGGIKDIGSYQQHGRLGKPLKPRKPLASAMKGFFVVSEKAIRADPKKWFHEKTEGHWLARSIQRDAEPIVARAIAQAVAAERAVAERGGRRL